MQAATLPVNPAAKFIPKPKTSIHTSKVLLFLVANTHTFREANNLSYEPNAEIKLKNYVKACVQASIDKKSYAIFHFLNVDCEAVNWTRVKNEYLKLKYGTLKKGQS